MKKSITILLISLSFGSYAQINTIKVGGVDTAAMLLPYKTSYPRQAISLTTIGSSGAATYNNVSGVLNIPQYSGGGGSQSLQDVTDVGNTTDNEIYSNGLQIKQPLFPTVVRLSDAGSNGRVSLLKNNSGSDATIYALGYTSSTHIFPNVSGYIPMTVNGNTADSNGNIIISAGSGTVTDVAALTLGTSGTDLSSSVATSTTTPVITLNVPTASASNRGALSSTDWSTFNNKLSTSTAASTYLPLTGNAYTTTTGNGLDINSSTLTTGTLVSIGLTGTAATSNTKTGLSVTSSGANGTASQTVTAGNFSITNTGTTGINRGLVVSATGAATNYSLFLTGHVAFSTDNAFDIGISNAANRARNIYAGGNITGGSSGYLGMASRFFFNSPSSGVVTLTNAALNDIDRLQFGGTTSSFPALKRSSADLLVKDAADGVASSLGVGVSSVVASAKFQVDATDKGFLPPRMTDAQKGAISSPATGLTVYCTDCTATDASTGVMQTYNGATWKNYW